MVDYGARITALVNQFAADVRRLAYRAVEQALTARSSRRLDERSTKGDPSSLRSVRTRRQDSMRIRRSGQDLARRSGEFLGFVTQNPGLRIEEINAALGTTTVELRLPIRKLLHEKALRAEGRLRGTRYFPA